ncbi:MAG: bifunctional diaminohydroxyphosphoribosylaminopyrimidine deaminase/5-amino-6-(5-phosphoribosylamino)uracil reductase RibD [Geminicoccaceae bacterium]
MSSKNDRHFMDLALRLAARGRGLTAPNPNVGCVIVQGDRIVGRGWTKPGGRPHAERVALDQAGELAAGATAYVTLEPCAHTGETPPCADGLIVAGIRRVVVGVTDPDPRVDGGGLATLRAAGVEVELGVMAEQAELAMAGFLTRLTEARPAVTIKLATSLDGRIATATGDSHWITGDAARQRAHLLRASHDAILIGSGTALADDPELTCRLPGLENCSPIRVVLDRRGRLPADSRLARSAARTPLWIVTSAEGASRLAPLSDAGVSIITLEEGDDHRFFGGAMAVLAERRVNDLLIEGGGKVAAAALRADMVDRVEWFHAASIIGGDGVSAVDDFGIETLADARLFRHIDEVVCGEDRLHRFERLR